MRFGVGARVMLHVLVDAQGIAERIHPCQTSLTSGALSDSDAARVRRAFEASAVRAVARWRFSPARIDGQPMGGHLVFPVDFRPVEEGPQVLVPGPVDPPPWHPVGEPHQHR
ncbi:MAG: hypothetical protein KF823_08760 [Xanthomonadales bacterium]|nr:hypothetical protein [Xanthomonadales bacterium]